MQITYWMVTCMPVGRKIQNIVFYRKVHNFQMVITVSKTSHISFKLVSTEFPQAHCMFLIVRSKGAINMNFGMQFRKYNVFQFPTQGHPWDQLVFELHEKL